jgi:hypothetical protein
MTLSSIDSAAARTLFTRLAGPDRKRTHRDYAYRLLHRDLDPDAVGCVWLWEVFGGRLAYQVAVERDEAGNLRPHCTCADAVYRAESEGRFCKHVLGLLRYGKKL